MKKKELMSVNQEFTTAEKQTLRSNIGAAPSDYSNLGFDSNQFITETEDDNLNVSIHTKDLAVDDTLMTIDTVDETTVAIGIKTKNLEFDSDTISLTSSDTAITIGAKDMTGATAAAAGKHGLVPAPGIADKDKFLKGDGTWGATASGPSTYVKSASVSGSTLTLTDQDDSTTTFTGGPSSYVKSASVSDNVLTLKDQDDTTTTFTGGAQSDWNVTDTSSPAYIANMPSEFRETVKQIIFDEATMTTDESQATKVVISVNSMSAATASAAGAAGIVPAPSAGSQNKFLRGDATWQEVTSGPSTYVKSATVSGTTLTLTDQSDTPTTFTGGPSTYVQSASVSSDNSTLTLTPNTGDPVTFTSGSNLPPGFVALFAQGTIPTSGAHVIAYDADTQTWSWKNLE